MFVSIAVMFAQIVFAFWCMDKLSDQGTWEDALLINWYHLLKIFMNSYISWGFVKRIRAKQPSSPIGYLSTYITMLFYLALLFVYAGEMPMNIEIESLYLLIVYAGSDWILLFFSWAIQKNVVARRNELFKFQAGGIN